MPLGIFRVTAFLLSPPAELHPPSSIPSLFINMPVSSSGCKLLQQQRPCFHSSCCLTPPQFLSLQVPQEAVTEPAVHISDGGVNSSQSDRNDTILAHVKTWHPSPTFSWFSEECAWTWAGALWVCEDVVPPVWISQELRGFTQSFRPCRVFQLPSNGINIPEPIFLVNLLGEIEWDHR